MEYDDFFQMFGRGRIANVNGLYADKLRCQLSPTAKDYWDQHIEFFSGEKRRSFYFRGSSGGIAKFVEDSIEAVFSRLSLRDNYFWRVYLTGEYSPDCCPEYLREENFHRLRNGLVDRISTHPTSLPYVPLIQAPWYSFLGRKRADSLAR